MNSAHLSHQLDGCRRHDRASQAEVYRLFYRYALTVARAYAGSMDEAREVVNDAFLRAFTKIEHYDTWQPFKPWFNRVVVHAAIDHYRRYQAKQQKMSDELPLNLPDEGRDSTILEKLSVEETILLVQKLPPAYRTVMSLYAIEGYEHQEIAELLGISEGTSKSNLFKARARLRDFMARRDQPRQTAAI